MVRLLDELTDLEKLALIPMSYSRLNTYQMCESMYFFSYIKKDEGLFGEAAKLGNVVHAVLENQLERNVPILRADEEKYLAEFEIQREEYDPEHLISAEYIQAGHQMIQEFLDRHEGDKVPIVKKEMSFEIVIGPALFRGFIDRVDATRDTTYITDYKTGKNEVAAKNVQFDLQLGIYALAVKKLMPDRPVHAQLYYLKSGRQKGHLYTEDDLLAIESRLLELVEEIVDKRHFKWTDNPRICGFCDHAKSGVCGVGVTRLRQR